MHRFLMAPIQLDALHLTEPLTVEDALADFRRLPYIDDAAGDVNADTAYISENLVATPFHNQKLTLRAGVHLHWALPDALTRSHTVDKDTERVTFPAVPNLWLVTRCDADGDARHWIVESDYLHPKGAGAAPESICYPILPGHERGLPFRYMGRQLPLAEWLLLDKRQDKYLADETQHPLTALGYGEPTFAAFYPNCHSVFGFHDDEPPAPLAGVRYYVSGWYRSSQDDFCQSPAFRKALTSQSSDVVAHALQSNFNWSIVDAKGAAPDRLLCYARITLTSDSGGENKPVEAALKIAVGNTTTEALSAYLADVYGVGDPAKRREIEDQLESLYLMADLEHRQLDIGPKFREARHANGFRSSAGGSLWTIRRTSAGKDAPDSSRTAQTTLPDALAHALNQLNLAQECYDTARAQMNSLRQRLFADWYRYMLSAYPPDDQRDDYPDVDAVKFFIEEHDLKPLAELRKKAGSATLRRAPLHVPAAGIAEFTLGQQVNYWWNQVCDLLLDQQVDEDYAVEDWETFTHQLHAQPALAALIALSALPPAGPAADTDAARSKIMARLLALGQDPDLPGKLTFPGRTPAAALARQAGDPKLWTPAELQRYNRLLLQAYLPALGSPYSLHRTAGSRYWQPNEPVVLLTGPAVEPSDRHGQAEIVRCHMVDLDEGQLFDAVQAVQRMQAIDGLSPEAAAAADDNALAPQQPAVLAQRDVVGFRVSRGLPWHPFMLEWEVRVQPIGGVTSNLHGGTRSHAPEFIASNYHLTENALDLKLTTDPTPGTDHGIYQGRSILTPHAKLALHRQIDLYFEKQLLGAYYAAHPGVLRSHDFFSENRQAVIDWCSAAAPDVVDDFMRFILVIEEHVSTDFHLLAQSLSGLNAAFLGHKQTMQLSVADPLGFAEYQDFASRVHAAVGSYTRVAPQPMNDFNPIRSGHLTLTRLRLIDTFGRHRDLTGEELEKVICADTLQDERSTGRKGSLALAPRLMQPARLNLRWKANGHGPGHRQEEDHDDVEMNAHPATSPICGWLLPNNLDQSLMVYGPAGQALGYLDQNNRWRVAPGGSSSVYASSHIDNPHLRRVVQWLEREDAAFHDTFLATLDSALENIDPDSWALHQDLALLMGRPLAVVRASVQLELKGLPAINQSWEVFWQDLHNGRQWDADTDRVQDVLFPVRLGEHRQLNDGVAGYWIEDAEDGSLSTGFFAPQSDVDDAGSAAKRRHLIHTYGADQPDPEQEKTLQVQVRANGPAISLTLLLDPRGKLHATSGILPVQIVDIPPDQYAASLQAIEISFLSAPILSQRRQAGDNQPPELPLPDEPGYQWRWAERDANAQWHVSAPSGDINRLAHFAGPLEVREGWLLLDTTTDTARQS